VKFCFNCGHALTDEFVHLHGEAVDIVDALDELSKILKLRRSEHEGDFEERWVAYYCPSCHTLHLVDFSASTIKMVDWKEHAKKEAEE